MKSKEWAVNINEKYQGPILPGRGRLLFNNSNGHQGTSCRAAQTTPGARILFKPDQVPRSQDEQKSCEVKREENSSWNIFRPGEVLRWAIKLNLEI